jgi:hypothetical protein
MPLPQNDELMGQCIDPDAHPRWCQCKKVTEQLRARIADLEKLDIQVREVRVDQRQFDDMAERLRASHARETELNRLVYIAEHKVRSMRVAISEIVVRLAYGIANPGSSNVTKEETRDALNKILQAEP